jgi:hypothetical protein
MPCCHSLAHRTRIDDAAKFHKHTVAGGLDDPAVMLGNLRIDQLAAQRLEAFERAFLVGAHQPRIPRHIGGKDRGEAAGCGHPSGNPARRSAFSSAAIFFGFT